MVSQSIEINYMDPNYTPLPNELISEWVEKRAIDRLVVFFLGQITVVAVTVLVMHLLTKFNVI